MSQNPATDIVISFKKTEHAVPPGFTAEEFKESLASVDPEALNATLILDGEKNGKLYYTLKPIYGTKG